MLKALRYRCPIALLALPILLPSQAAAQIDDYERQGWTRVFSDEFNDASVNAGDWDILNRRDSFNNEKQYYRSQQVSTVDGKLRLTATNVPFGGKDYQSGLVRTHEEWSYGRFEVRGDLPTSQGMWPAIWLLPRTVNWPTGGEIDIMENRGSQPTLTSSAYHWQTNPNIPCCGAHQFVYEEHQATAPGGGLTNYHAGFHDYAVEWEPEEIRFYVDGLRHFTVTNETAPIFDTAKSLILNLAVGGDFGGDPNGSTSFPQHFDIEYARVWQRENGFFGLVNGGFDEAGDGLNDWSTFNQVNGNIEVSTLDSYTGEAAIRIAAQPGDASFAGLYQGVKIDGGETLRLRAESLIPTGESFGNGSRVSLKLEFYTEFGGGYGSSSFLGEEVLTIADAGTTTDAWLHNERLFDAPNNAVEARVTLIVEEGEVADGSVLVDGLSLVAVDPLTGDYNFDGLVDAADYTAWRDTLGSTTNLAADGNRDGTVNAADLTVWQSNYGATAGSSVAVPEPAMSILLVAGLAVGVNARRRG